MNCLKIHWILFVSFSVLLCLSIGSEAQDEDKVVELEEIEVTTTRVKKQPTAIPNTITIIDRKTLNQQSIISNDMSSVLERTVPGFGPSLQKLVGRGESLRGRNPLYLIDGIPQHNPLRDGQRDGHTIDIDFLEKVEVIHGSNAIQGIGATGGVVNMATKSPTKDGKWTNYLKFGTTTHDSFDGTGIGYKASYLGGQQFGDSVDVMGGVSFHRRGLQFDAEATPVGMYATQGDIMNSNSYDLFLKAGYEPDQSQRVQLMANLFNLAKIGDFMPKNGDRKKGIFATTVEVDADERAKKVGDPTENSVSTISLDYSNTELNNGSLSGQLYVQNFSALYEGGTYVNAQTGLGFYRKTPTGPAFLDQSQIKSNKLGAKTIYTWNEIPDLLPSIGFDFAYDNSTQVLAKSDRNWVPELKLSSYAPFVQVDYKIFDMIRLSGGLRYEIASLKVDDYTTIAAYNSTPVSGGNSTYTRALPNIGLILSPIDITSAYVSYSNGFSMPDVGRVLRGINKAGQDVESILTLEPVVTQNYEIGLNQKLGPANLNASYYLASAKLGSLYKLNDSNIFEVIRQATVVQGLQLTVDASVTEQVNLGLTYAQTDGKYDSNEDEEVDTDMDGLNIAPNRFNIFADFELPLQISGRLQVSSLLDRNFEGDDKEAKHIKNPDVAFEGYTTADLFLQADTSFGRFSVGVANLLDNQYARYFSQVETNNGNNTFFAGTGRTITGNFQYNF